MKHGGGWFGQRWWDLTRPQRKDVVYVHMAVSKYSLTCRLRRHQVTREGYNSIPPGVLFISRFQEQSVLTHCNIDRNIYSFFCYREDSPSHSAAGDRNPNDVDPIIAWGMDTGTFQDGQGNILRGTFAPFYLMPRYYDHSLAQIRG